MYTYISLGWGGGDRDDFSGLCLRMATSVNEFCVTGYAYVK